MIGPVTPVIALPPLFDEPAVDLSSFMPDDLSNALNHIMQVQITERQMPFTNAAQHAAPNYVKDWDSYVGQGPMKRRLQVDIDDALARNGPLEHTLLASGMPGVGKTTLARLIAQKMDVEITMLVPPFTAQTLYDAALSMGDWGILFVDEIHKLADHGPAASENLYHMMEEGVLYLDDGVHVLADFTLIGATTDADKLPEAIIDRFVIKPYFQKYSLDELRAIAVNFCNHFELDLPDDILMAIAMACRGAPRNARDLVVAGRALTNHLHRPPTVEELLEHAELEPDGTTRQHKAYLTAMFQFFGREIVVNDKPSWEYVAGEASLMNILRENKPGLARLERFLIETGLVDRTPRGRRLTPRGIVRAREFVNRGQGLATG